MVDVLLVNPPVNRLCGLTSNYFPLGTAYIAATSKRMGLSVIQYNAEFEREPSQGMLTSDRIHSHNNFINSLSNEDHRVWQEYKQIVEKYRPRIVGFSCTSASIMPCIKMAGMAKDICGATSVFGGMHPTILPEETAAYPVVDYIQIGEGEATFPLLAQAILNGTSKDNIPGVGYWDEGLIHLTPSAPLKRNLDSLPLPDWESMIFLEEHKPSLGGIITSRGCPFKCTFCSGRKMHQGRTRYRSIDSVFEETMILQERFGVSHITYFDDCFALKKQRVAELCNKLIEHKSKATWGAFTRADVVESDLLQLMKKSGCTFLGVGVESGSDNTLKEIRKGYTREKALAGVKKIKDAGIHVGMNIIVGMPNETRQDILDTISLIKELDVPTNVNTFTPYPGSPLYDECAKLGLIDDKIDWTLVSQHSPYNNFIYNISEDEYRELLAKMLQAADKASEAPGLLRRAARIKGRFSTGIIGAVAREVFIKTPFYGIWLQVEDRPWMYPVVFSKKLSAELPESSNGKGAPNCKS